jgi:PIN domain nuclease of toxin-antitoxin system
MDASALLVLLRDEPGADRVADALALGGWISAVNWAEVLTKLADLGLEAEAVSRDLSERMILGVVLHVRPFDEEQALEAARLRPLTRSPGLSLGDRACLGLARVLRLPVVTADRSWASLDLGVAVELVR